MKTVELKEGLRRENALRADELRAELTTRGIVLINVMSSPGSGKTSVLKRTIRELGVPVGVLECDIDSDVDAYAVAEAGGRAVQLHTGGMCHMDAFMTRQGLEALEITDEKLIFIENIGNLVCPAEFDTGAHYNITILSVPEGDDKPAKYPLMYQVCDAVLINKTDVAQAFDFDIERCRERVAGCNPGSVVLPLSAKTGAGFGQWINWLKERLLCEPSK